jgi:hypothetical protein
MNPCQTPSASSDAMIHLPPFWNLVSSGFFRFPHFEQMQMTLEGM